MVITSALHAEGHGFNPHPRYVKQQTEADFFFCHVRPRRRVQRAPFLFDAHVRRARRAPFRFRVCVLAVRCAIASVFQRSELIPLFPRLLA